MPVLVQPRPGGAAPGILGLTPALTELKGLRVLLGNSQAPQTPGERSNSIPAVSLVFPELLLQVSSLNSASDKSEGTCL